MAIKLEDRPGAKAEVRFVRMSASKARLVLGTIRGKKVSDALMTLELSERRASETVSKCLKSAIANADHNESIPFDELYIFECFADEGPTLKRFKPRARGRASSIHKQTCHITIQVCRYTDEELEILKESAAKKLATAPKKSKKAKPAASRADRVAKSKKESPAPVAASDEETSVEAESPPMPDAEIKEDVASEAASPPMPDAEAKAEPSAEVKDENKEEEAK